MPIDLETQLATCLARRAKAATAVEAAERAYDLALRDGSDDRAVSKASAALDNARRSVVIEEDRERVIRESIAARDAEAKRQAEAETWRTHQSRIAEVEKLAERIEAAITVAGVDFKKLTGILASLPALHVDGRPDVNQSLFLARNGLTASLVRAGIADWTIPNSGELRASRLTPNFAAAVKNIGARLADQRAEAVAHAEAA